MQLGGPYQQHCQRFISGRPRSERSIQRPLLRKWEREQAEKARVDQEEVSAVLRAQQEPKIRRVDSTMAEEKQREREVYERQVSAPHSADPRTALERVAGSRSTHPV